MNTDGPLDRNLQLELLQAMSRVYPEPAERLVDDQSQEDTVVANLVYLREHGLCEVEIYRQMGGPLNLGPPTITAAGLDFLADDGGLSAILGVVTVKLHADTIRDLIAAKIEASPLPEEKKAGLRAALAKLPAVALQEGSKRLMGLGIDHIGDVGAWLQHLPEAVGL